MAHFRTNNDCNNRVFTVTTLFHLIILFVSGKMTPKVPFGNIFFPAIKNYNGNGRIIGGDEAQPRQYILFFSF